MAPHVNQKYYVVWEGHEPGIYDNWADAQDKVQNYPGARFKSFSNLEDATEAFRGDPNEYLKIFQAMGSRPVRSVNYDAFPEIKQNAIAVDGACAGNPGMCEYQGVHVGSGQQIFHAGPYPGGTNNIVEYIAIIHAAALLAKKNDTTTPIYSDSVTAMAWVRRRHSNTKIQPSEQNSRIMEMLERANRWIASHSIPNPILKWDTEKWGEIPADFNRK